MSTSEPDRRYSAPRTARERARAEITKEILDAGRRYLSTDGAAGLSLRAIARDLGMASSAVYRYVASRDELLTKLIIDAYDSLGATAEAREAKVDRADLFGRWSAVCHSVRDWARANPNEYALVYGSPVPGYVAPEDTVAPATRVSILLVNILRETTPTGPPAPTTPAPAEAPADSTPADPTPAEGTRADHPTSAPAPDSPSGPLAPMAASIPSAPGSWQSALDPVRAVFPSPFSDAVIQVALMVWSGLFGVVSFELFGQFHNVVAEDPGQREAFFAECVRRWGEQLGLAG